MTPLSTRALALLFWAISFIPVVLFAMWWGLTEWTWRGFATAYAIMAAIAFSYDITLRLVERWLRRRRERRASTPEH